MSEPPGCQFEKEPEFVLKKDEKELLSKYDSERNSKPTKENVVYQMIASIIYLGFLIWDIKIRRERVEFWNLVEEEYKSSRKSYAAIIGFLLEYHSMAPTRLAFGMVGTLFYVAKGPSLSKALSFKALASNINSFFVRQLLVGISGVFLFVVAFYPALKVALDVYNCWRDCSLLKSLIKALVSSKFHNASESSA